MPDKSVVLITDTVGFIHKLPPTIISAFRATLEELSGADLLVHLVDITSLNAAEQCTTVENILGDLELEDKRRITVLNKIDLLLDPHKDWNEKSAMEFMYGADIPDRCNVNEDTVFLSASRKWGFERLLELTGRVLAELKV